VGFALPRALLSARCALTAPFHPYRAPQSQQAKNGLAGEPAARRYVFCGAFRHTGLEPGCPDVIRHTALWSSDFPLPVPCSLSGPSVHGRQRPSGPTAKAHYRAILGKATPPPGSVEYSLLLSPAECDRLWIVLARTRNPLNLGAAARAMSNFGFSRLRVVNPYPVAFREARSAVGAGAVLAGAEEYADLAAAVADCTLVCGTTAGSRRELQQPLEDLRVAARPLRQHLRSSRVALVFGSEKTGLTNLELSHCHRVLRIPTTEAQPSMNLGQAVAVCLYELTRGLVRPRAALEPHLLPPEPETDEATSGQLERLTAALLEALQVSGYLNSSPLSSSSSGPGNEPTAAAEEKARRMVHRLRLPSRDADVLVGMLRKMLWKMRHGS